MYAFHKWLNHPINSFKRFCNVIHEKFSLISIEKKLVLNQMISLLLLLRLVLAITGFSECWLIWHSKYHWISWTFLEHFLNISNESSEWWRWDQNANWRYQYQNWHYFNHFFFEYIIEMTFLSGRLEVESDQPFVTINFNLLSATFMLGSEIFNLKFILESF